MIAWDELDGSASHHVNRFHKIAPISPASTTHTNAGSAALTLTRLETVLATPWWNTNSARKLKDAAQITARMGVRSRVDTIVAIEFAASWKPLIRSKIRATAMVTTTTVVTLIGAFCGSGLETRCFRGRRLR